MIKREFCTSGARCYRCRWEFIFPKRWGRFFVRMWKTSRGESQHAGFYHQQNLAVGCMTLESMIWLKGAFYNYTTTQEHK